MSGAPVPAENPPVVTFRDLSLRYKNTVGLDSVSLEIPSRKLIGLIGPDGVGKSTLLSLITGAHAMQEGTLEVLGGDMRDLRHRNAICPKIAYMPQGLGKNLYFTLTVEENLQFFGRLFGHNSAERRRALARRLGLPQNISASALIEAINLTATKEEFEAAINDIEE